MLQGLSRLSITQRRFVFFMIFVGGLFVLLALTVLLYTSALNRGRSEPVALVPEVSVSTLAALPDDDAYPPAVAITAAGDVLTGSFATGAVWQIAPDGTPITELPGTRDAIGAVSAITVMPSGELIVLDVLDSDPRSSGGQLWRIGADGVVEPLAGASSDWIAPNDMTLDGQGRLYVTDSGRNEVLRFDLAAGTSEVFWVAPGDVRSSLTGITYDAANDAVIITDPESNRVYRVAVADGASTLLYEYGIGQTPPGFDGAVVLPNGAIYVAALGQNGIARLNLETNDLDYIAGLFRGSSDVDYDSLRDRLIVPNFDQSSLVLPLVSPSLPFTIDQVVLNGPAATDQP